MKNDEPKTLDWAIRFAAEHHSGQTTLRGNPYILHPLRVMAAMSTDEEMMVAVLHDVIEDTAAVMEDLEGLPYRVTEAVRVLTHLHGVRYEDYIDLVYLNVLATKVKLADLADNMRVERLPVLDSYAVKRLRKYRAAVLRLTC